MSRRLPLFYAVTAIFWFAIYAYVPFVSPYSEYLGANLRLIGLIVGAYGFTQMAIRFPLGILSDRLGRRKIFILGGLFFTAASGLVVFLFPHPYTMLLSRSLAGVAAASWVTFAILHASYYPPEAATKSVGFLNSANAMGLILAFLFGSALAQWRGVNYAFLLGGLAGLIGLVVGFAIIEKRPDVKAKPPGLKDLLGVVGNRQLLAASFLAILSQYITFATAFGFTPLLADGVGASQLQLGMLGLAVALPRLIVAPFAGTLVPQKIGTRNTIALGFLLMVLACVLFVFVTEMWQLYVVQALVGTGTTLAYTLLMGLSIRDVSGEKRATAMGFFQAVYGLGMFIGPFVTGWVAFGFGLRVAFLFTGVVALCGVVAARWFARVD